MATILGIVLFSFDPEKTKLFYQCLGISFEQEQHGSGPVHFSSALSSGAICEIYKRTPSQSDDKILIEVDSIAQCIKNLQDQGFLQGQVVIVSKDQKQLILHDPDGRPVYLLTPERLVS